VKRSKGWEGGREGGKRESSEGVEDVADRWHVQCQLLPRYSEGQGRC
jgi:hypothetical protein